MSLKYRVADYLADTETVIPGTEEVFVGDGDFRAIGAEFVGHLIDLAALRENSAIIDIGCGQGRLALPLTYTLSPKGSYIGLDIVADGIRWCQEVIAPLHPRFSFRHVDVYHPLYNPAGTMRCPNVSLPVGDDVAELIVMTSVFTHFDQAMARTYAKEVARILKPGGICFATFFVMNAERKASITKGTSRYAFCVDGPGPVYSPAGDTDLGAVAMDEGFVIDTFAEAGLSLDGPIRYGFWPTDDSQMGVAYQDICLFTQIDGAA